jgi:hypothetical protein
MIKPIILIVTLVASLIAQGVYTLKDDRTANTDPKDPTIKKYWHWAGGVLHVWLYYVMSDSYGIGWGLLTAASTWLLYDGAINYWVLNLPFFNVGNTAFIDKMQNWAARKTGLNVGIISAALKLTLLATAIYTLIKTN